jgi:hypothetical protein
MLWTCSQEMLGSSIGRDTSYSGSFILVFCLPGQMPRRYINWATATSFQILQNLAIILPCNSDSVVFFLVSLGGVRLSTLGSSATVGLLYQPRMLDDDDYGAVGGMRIGRGNRSTRRKPAPVPLCPPQIPHNLTWDRTRAAAVGSRRLTAWAMARP